jgi:hypothetical protein
MNINLLEWWYVKNILDLLVFSLTHIFTSQPALGIAGDSRK